MNDQPNKESNLGLLNILALVLSSYVLIALVVDTFFVLRPDVSQVLGYIDNLICIFFLIEFGVRFFKADSKLKFMKWGWIDLVSSIPNLEFLRFGRLFRLIKILRILRAFRSMRHIINHIYKSRTQGALTTIAVLSFLLLIFSSISILQFESADPEANIKTAEDALWWAYVTMTTVGYGDKYPVTTGGRVIAAMLMTAGVGLFGTFTAYVSSLLLVERKAEAQGKQDESGKGTGQ